MMPMWESCPDQVSLANNAVHIWRVNLDVPEWHIPSLQRLLSPCESDRANKFQFERDRRRFIVSHGVLRLILSRYLDCKPERVDYQIQEFGKPYISNKPNFQFNMAHSHEIALVAVTALGEIGVDIEYIRPIEDIDQLARQCFSTQEFQQYKRFPDPENRQAFFACWTRKEAFIKALGSGLAYPLENFTVSIFNTEPARLVTMSGKPDEVEKWTLHAFEIGADYTAAFALRSPVPIVKYMEWV